MLAKGLQRAQASVELLILAAALFAFLLAFVPVINEARELVRFSIASKQAELALDELLDALREAAVLGSGSVISREITLDGDAGFWYDEASSKLNLGFRAWNKSKMFSREVLVPVSIKEGNLTRGSYRARIGASIAARIAGAGSAINVEFVRASE